MHEQIIFNVWDIMMTLNKCMSLRPGSHSLLAKSFYFAKSPMIIIGEDGRIEEINATCRVLMGTDIAGCKDCSFGYILKQLEPKIDGKFIKQCGTAIRHLSHSNCSALNLDVDDLDISVSECRYYSSLFGLAKLRIFELPSINIVSGQCFGSIINIEIIAIEKHELFHQAVLRRWRREIMWEVYATSYDRILLELPFYQEVLNRHCRAMENDGIKKVLDIGAGTGNVTISLLKQGKHVTAVDIGRAMIEKLYSKVESIPNNNLTIIEDTAERLPHFEDHSFDGVTALLSFFDMQDPHAALQEVERVLKPGGKVVITDPKRCANVEQLMTEAEKALIEKGVFNRLSEDWNRIQTVAPFVNETVKLVQSNNSSIGDRPAWHAEAIFKILSDCGYSDLTMEDSHLGNCATITGIKQG